MTAQSALRLGRAAPGATSAMALLATGVMVTLAGRAGRVRLYVIMPLLGARLARGSGNGGLPSSALPEDKLDVGSFLLAGNESPHASCAAVPPDRPRSSRPGSARQLRTVPRPAPKLRNAQVRPFPGRLVRDGIDREHTSQARQGKDTQHPPARPGENQVPARLPCPRPGPDQGAQAGAVNE